MSLRSNFCLFWSRKRANYFAADDVAKFISFIEGLSYRLTAGHVQILESFGKAQTVFVGKWNDLLLEKLHLLNDENQFGHLLDCAMLRPHFG